MNALGNGALKRQVRRSGPECVVDTPCAAPAAPPDPGRSLAASQCPPFSARFHRHHFVTMLGKPLRIPTRTDADIQHQHRVGGDKMQPRFVHGLEGQCPLALTQLGSLLGIVVHALSAGLTS